MEINLKEYLDRNYVEGFSTNVDSYELPPGISEEVVRQISKSKNEPEWLLEWRLKSFDIWKNMKPPSWSSLRLPEIDFGKISYMSTPKAKNVEKLEDLDPEILKTYEKLGISLNEQKRINNIAVDAVFDSSSVITTFKKELEKLGIFFCSFSEAVHLYPDIVKKYLGSVVPARDNFYSALNSAVFSDGSFVYIPPGIKCPMELSTYFRINSLNSGQFERTLIIADTDSYVSYNEGCTAARNEEYQLHAAVVELVALENATIKYSTIQNWFPGNKETGQGGIFNFVTKRGKCSGKNSKISWIQVETGSAITWKYPSCLLIGDGSVGEFYSVAISNNMQQADTGTKMIHIGKNTKSYIVSKGISAGHGRNIYRGLVKISKGAVGSKNYTQCDSLIIGDSGEASTIPYIECFNNSSELEHEASTSKISEDQLFYLQQRGISKEDSISMIVNGFCKEIIKNLPMEFSAEAQKLLGLSLEGSVG